MGASRTELEVYAHDVVLRDGRTLHIRPIRPDDADAMYAMWQRLSTETIRLRFFAPRSMSRQGIEHFVNLDMRDRFAMVGVRGEAIVGVSRFERLAEEPDVAEFAVLVEDAEQGRGIGTALLRALLEPAQDRGIERFVAEVLPENRKMLGVMTDAGLAPKVDHRGQVVETAFTTTPGDEFFASADEQDRIAAVNALQAVFEPRAVAVIGASRDPGTIGGLVFRNLLSSGFTGPVYPVNAKADHVQSVVAYPSVRACPSVPDLVVVCVPAPCVSEVVEEAAALGVRAAVIISAGFNEAGGEGEARERELRSVARQHGIRLVGPNCMGVLNTQPERSLNATFAEQLPPAGRVAFSSQSGALGLAVLDAAQRLGVGLSSFASIGNKADISGNDLLQYWEADDDTDLVLMYLESFGNPRKFGRITRRMGRRKPIVAVKSGRTSAGERAASSHTGALAAGDATVEALFRQAGVIRCDTLEEMFHVAQLLGNQPLPAGRGVGILTNGGGPGILAADACESNGLTVAELADDTVARLGEVLPAEAGIRNPVDMVASATPASYQACMRILADDPQVHVLLVIFVPPVIVDPSEVAREVAAANTAINADRAEPLPVLGVFMSEGTQLPELSASHIPAFTFPEDAARALGRVTRYAEWRRAPLGNVVAVGDADVDSARAVVAEALPPATDTGTVERAWLDVGQCQRLLCAFGIATARGRVASDPEQAAAIQRELAVPVAVKSAAPVHKTELGGVRLDLATPEEAAAAVAELDDHLRASGHPEAADAGFLIQEMVGEGVEMVVGASYDHLFGHVLLAGMGGILVELLGDVSVRVHPLTDVDVEEMLSGLRGFPLLTGYRGSEPVDVPALRALLFRVSALVEEIPEIDELDLNPVFVRQHGIAAVDARIRVARHRRAPR